MTYQEQLQTQNWIEKRLQILERDSHCCNKCQLERPRFLGLLQGFGIKTIEQMRKEEYGIIWSAEEDKNYITQLLEKNGCILVRNNYCDFSTLIGEKDATKELSQLKFALQREDIYTKKSHYKMICFFDDITDDYKFPDLNIHHKYYLLGKNAWEYDNDALITLCVSCHMSEHETQQIYVYSMVGEVLFKAETCGKCKGSGYLPEFHYFQNGVCFQCFGHGVMLNE